MTPDHTTIDLLAAAMYAAIGLVAGGLLSILLSVVARLFSARHPYVRFLSRRMKRRQRIVLIVLGTSFGVWWASRTSVAHGIVHWHRTFQHGFVIATIIGIGWLLTGGLASIEDAVLDGTQQDVASPTVRRLQTQMQVVNRVGSVIIWLIALAIVLYTFPQMRVLGTSMFASAGVLSIVAGLAAQSTLSNLFAGLQLAFTDAIRVGDAVVVHLPGQSSGTMGRIEEITLTYVVVRVWDERRIILPSTHFTTTGFENWSRRDPEMLGTVEFDLDWMVPVEAMRAEFKRQLSDLDLWDGRVGVLQVTDTVGTYVRVRALVSARNSSELWDLRCQIREGMVDWLQNTVAFALPRVRMEPRPTSAPSQQLREELVEQAKRDWEQKRAADESQDAVMTQFLDAADHSSSRITASGGSSRRRPKSSIYGSTRRNGWTRTRRGSTNTSTNHPLSTPGSGASVPKSPGTGWPSKDATDRA